MFSPEESGQRKYQATLHDIFAALSFLSTTSFPYAKSDYRVMRRKKT